MQLIHASPKGDVELYYSPLAESYIFIKDGSATTYNSPQELPEYFSEHLFSTITEDQYKAPPGKPYTIEQLNLSDSHGSKRKTKRMQINSRNDLHVVASNYRHQLIEGYLEHNRIFKGVLRDIIFHPEETSTTGRTLAKRYRLVASFILEDTESGVKSTVQIEQKDLGVLSVVSLFVANTSTMKLGTPMTSTLKVEEPKPLNVYEIAALVYYKHATITNVKTGELISGKVTSVIARPHTDPHNHTLEVEIRFGRLGTKITINSSDINNKKYTIDVKEAK